MQAYLKDWEERFKNGVIDDKGKQQREHRVAAEQNGNHRGLGVFHGQLKAGHAYGNANQAHTYTPIEFSVTDTDEYTFVKKYKPVERTQDIAVLLWNEGYSFCINNTSCSYIQIENSAGAIKDIFVESIPFVYYSNEIPVEYSFLDIDKNPLP